MSFHFLYSLVVLSYIKNEYMHKSIGVFVYTSDC